MYFEISQLSNMVISLLIENVSTGSINITYAILHSIWVPSPLYFCNGEYLIVFTPLPCTCPLVAPILLPSGTKHPHFSIPSGRNLFVPSATTHSHILS